MDDEIRDDEDQEQQEKDQNEKKELGDYLFHYKRKFDNFWYHYKVAAIISIILLAFIVFCIAQCAGRIKGDANIGYIGSEEINAETFDDLQNALSEILGEDLNGDGKIHVDFTHFMYMTNSQIEKVRARGQPVEMQSLLTVQTQISLELAAGNIVIYFIDLDVYKEQYANSRLFMPLEDALGYLPEDAYDVYSLRLGSLPCHKYYMGLDNFPSSTIVAVRDMHVSEEENKETQERYARNLLMFKRLVEFKYLPEDENTED